MSSRSTVDVPNARVAICLELVPASSEKVLDGSKVLLANIKVFTELFSDMCEQH